MGSKKTSVFTIVMYIIGTIFLIVSAFMLVTAISYTKTYLQSYDASFSDMWSNSLQYIITRFAPYLGFAVVAFGVGKAVSEFLNRGSYGGSHDGSYADQSAAGTIQARASNGNAAVSQETANGTSSGDAKSIDLSELEDKIKYLTGSLDTTLEVISIKIEEKEKRDTYRLGEVEKKVDALIQQMDVDLGSVVLVDTGDKRTPEADAEKVKASEDDAERVEASKADAEKTETSNVDKKAMSSSDSNAEETEDPEANDTCWNAENTPELFRAPSSMEMPDISRVPQVMRHVKVMAMPDIKSVPKKTIETDVSQALSQDTNSNQTEDCQTNADQVANLQIAAPPIMRHVETMVMPGTSEYVMMLDGDAPELTAYKKKEAWSRSDLEEAIRS